MCQPLTSTLPTTRCSALPDRCAALPLPLQGLFELDTSTYKQRGSSSSDDDEEGDEEEEQWRTGEEGEGRGGSAVPRRRTARAPLPGARQPAEPSGSPASVTLPGLREEIDGWCAIHGAREPECVTFTILC